jgi:hypothetical protein
VVAYVAFVAILNVFLGMVLARIIPAGDALPRRAPTRLRASHAASADLETAHADADVFRSSIPNDAQPTQQQTVCTPNNNEANSTKPSRTPQAAAKTWDDFAHQLKGIKDRAQYCRSARDMRLVQQNTEQLKACAQVWYSQLEQCLAGQAPGDASQTLSLDVDLIAVEMFAAQIESTISNLEGLSFTGPVDDLLNTLDRELDLLDKQQKQVARSRKKAAT